MRHGSGLYLAAAVLTGLIFTAALTAPLSALASTPGSTASALPAPPSDHPIRIGLGYGLTGAEVASQAGLLVIAEGKLLLELPGAQPVSLKLAAGKIQVAGVAAPLSGPVRLVPKPAAAPNYVLYAQKPYRGEIEVVVASTGRLSVVNYLNLEEYLLGVVPREMSSSWPLEAIKAQAVAARTYAVANMGKQRAHGFDLMPNTADQAYGGVAVETARATQAVTETRGQILTYNGRPVAAYYHSSSGGHTENNEFVWTTGSPQAYLRGVVDYDNVPDYDNLKGNPHFSWSHQFTPAEFTEKLRAAGYDLGPVKAVKPGPPGASGKPTTWTVEGGSGQVTLSMQQMRLALGLRAAPRAIKFGTDSPATVTTPPPEPVHVVGAAGQVSSRPLAGSHVVSAGGKVSQLPARPAVALGSLLYGVVGKTPPAPPPPDPVLTSLEVSGGGNGHGVGMSQWGAHGLARQGKNYVQILTHFYSGTKVETR
ncbi:MAG: SpoIID/LytB domain-containing protein [Bacillota bacterium]